MKTFWAVFWECAVRDRRHFGDRLRGYQSPAPGRAHGGV